MPAFTVNASSSSRKRFIHVLHRSLQALTTHARSSIKVITITGLIILGIVLDLGGGPNHDRIGFRYWKHPGPFAHYGGIAGSKGQFLGWWAVMTQAAFSFIGTEIVAVRLKISFTLTLSVASHTQAWFVNLFLDRRW